jgi:hypothetical protein
MRYLLDRARAPQTRPQQRDGLREALIVYTTRPLIPTDLNWFPQAVYSWIATYRYSDGGRTLTPETANAMLWRGVLTHSVVLDNAPVCLMQVSHDDLQNGVADLDVLHEPSADTQQLRAIVTAFLQSAIDAFPLRKVYVRVLEPRRERVLGLLDGFIEEARFTDHERLSRDMFLDLVVLSCRV